MMVAKKNGYDLAEEVFKRIGDDKNHEISYDDMINVISFWGFNEEADRATTIGFVCYCARLKLKKIFERALVYGDYRMYDTFIKQIEKSTPLPKGRWTIAPIGGYMLLHQCSNCLRHSVVKSKYCPNCGVKMVESEDK